MVALDDEMQHELRCPDGCGRLLRDPLIDEHGVTRCRRCLPPEAVSFEQAVPNQLIATLAGRQEYKDALRDAGGVPPDGMPQMVSAKDLKKMAESPG